MVQDGLHEDHQQQQGPVRCLDTSLDVSKSKKIRSLEPWGECSGIAPQVLENRTFSEDLTQKTHLHRFGKMAQPPPPENERSVPFFVESSSSPIHFQWIFLFETDPTFGRGYPP